MYNKILNAKINKIIKFSNVDGPGNRLAIFFQNCNFNCQYCHNPETINYCQNCGNCVKLCSTKSLYIDENNFIKWNENTCCECDICIKNCKFNASPKTKLYSVNDIIEIIKPIKPFINGITVSGGESSLQYKFITILFKSIKKLYPNITCFVDTNGSLDLQNIKYFEFVKYTDFFMLDIKAWNLEEHINLTGYDNKNVIKNLEFLKQINKLYEVRTVIIDNNLNNLLTVEKVSKLIANTFIQYKIIKYRHFGVREKYLENLCSPSDIQMKNLKKISVNLGVSKVIII